MNPDLSSTPYTKASSDFIRKYLSGIFLIICLIVASVFAGFYLKADLLIKEQMRQQNRAVFDAVRLHRQWASGHSGIYVKQMPGMVPNPYLKDVPGLKPVIRDQDGVSYILKNPALITREVSELSGREGAFSFRIVSLKPLNPVNMPDAFERTALELFTAGQKEHFRFLQDGSRYLFRYMAPLVTEQSCLTCHAHQGYTVGDIRGGISITTNATVINGQMHRNRIYLVLSAMGIVGLVFLTIYFISSVLIRHIKEAEEKLVEMAVKDPLTGLLNRREAFRLMKDEISRSRRSGRAISVIIADIDHFKQVNDTCGHAAGDEVLKYMAVMMQTVLREYDIICRYGGEEFLVLTPETNQEQAYQVAERLRAAVEATPAALAGRTPIPITISAGVAQMNGQETPEQVIARADAALYNAKQHGRNRVETG